VTGVVEPKTHSSTVNVNKKEVVRHNDKVKMNAKKKKAPHNTDGRVCMAFGKESSMCITPEGEIEFMEDKEKPPLTEADWDRAAEQLGVEKAAIKAVAEVETKGAAFLANGHPPVLFEGHLFRRYTSKAFDVLYPTLSFFIPKKPGADAGAEAMATYNARMKEIRSYYQGGVNEVVNRLDVAAGLNADAAYRASSWGRFQILGNNYSEAGFNNVQDFVAAMFESEQAQLDAFVNFVQSDKVMLKALQERDWATFARRYNGPDYERYKYDKQMKAAYEKHKKEEEAKAKAKDGTVVLKK
jgi:hypothetical protein